MTVLLNPMAQAPVPQLHPSIRKPKISVSQYEGPPWYWDPALVSLIRAPHTKTLLEQIAHLAIGHKEHLFRPLTAAEMMQILPLREEYPEKWRRKQGGRLFFGGSVYEILYHDDEQSPAKVHMELAPCLFFDDEWYAQWLPLTVPLRPEDVCLCVPFGMNNSIPDRPVWSLPKWRRHRGAHRAVSLLPGVNMRVRTALVPMPPI